MKKLPGIMTELRYFISCTNQVINIELYHNRYEIACQVSLLMQVQANTPYGLVANPNIQTNLSWLLTQCQREKQIHITNKATIVSDCMRYISEHVQHVNVVNYLIFLNQENYEYPQYSHSYTQQFSPHHLIANVSALRQSIDDIEMLQVFNYLRTAYKKTGSHIHVLPLIGLTA